MAKTYATIPPITVLDGGPVHAFVVGFNARHNLYSIKIFNGIVHPGATLGQEVYEWSFQRRWGVLLASPLIAASVYFAVHGGAGAYILALLAFLAFMIGPTMPSITREMEIRGHAIEVAIAVKYYGWDLDEMLYREATSLLLYDQFEGHDPDEIGDRLEDAVLWAEDWADKHRNWVLKWVNRLPQIV